MTLTLVIGTIAVTSAGAGGRADSRDNSLRTRTVLVSSAPSADQPPEVAYWSRLAKKRLRLLGARERRIVKLLRRIHRLEHPARHRSSSGTPWYVTKQIWAGNILGRESSGDPWPNCPDPYDGGGYSWQDTVNCENGGSWLDSPGYYRCGLQFDPGWERRFGRLCP